MCAQGAQEMQTLIETHCGSSLKAKAQGRLDEHAHHGDCHGWIRYYRRCCEWAARDIKSPHRYMRETVQVAIEEAKPELEKIYARYHPRLGH